MGKRGRERLRCTSCGGFKRKGKSCRKCNSHHTRPTSRGGNDGYPNEVKRSMEEEHDPWHNLNVNLRVGEAARLALFDWETYNPHLEKRENFTEVERLEKRISSWDLLYGKNATKRVVLEIIINKFTRLEYDRNHIRRVLKEALEVGKIGKKDFNQLIKLLDKKIEE